MRKNQNGFSVVELVIILVILGGIGLVGWRVMSKPDKQDKSTGSQTVAQQTSDDSNIDKIGRPIWQQTETGWRATETAPDCPSQPMMKLPADRDQITAVLYPGQTRGSYKPHGGFRFDNATDNNARVTAPIDGYIVKGSRYLAEGTEEVQYTFDIFNNCGVMVRLGHLRELPAEYQAIIDKFPAATASSQLQMVNPAVYVKQGTLLATKVGITTEKNTFFDWGVYDFRQQNQASQAAAYQAAHPMRELDWHAVCWLDGWLPAGDQARLLALPAGDPKSGKTSDYC